MSASLVGSEMCIRDSHCTACLACAHAASGPPFVDQGMQHLSAGFVPSDSFLSYAAGGRHGATVLAVRGADARRQGL
eukprot:14932591-Alexandrium_andersonii.AAC.1